MFLNLILIVIGIAALYFGGNWLVDGASRLARSLGIPAIIVGLTVVAFGTSTPELLVSLDAALRGSSDISVGNIVGSNIANIGLILGLAAFVYPVAVHIDLLRREIPIMIAVSVLAFLLFQDREIGRSDGFIFLVAFAGFIAMTVILALRARKEDKAFAKEEAELEATEEPIITADQRPREIMRLIVGLVVLMIGARMTVDGATALAREIGISELVIGITLVAVGTSLPELATSVIAALKRQSDIAIGNVVGSNIFNILFILGVTAVLKPIPVAAAIVQRDSLIMIGFAVLVFPLALNLTLTRREAVIFLLAYLGFLVMTFSG